MPEQRFSRANLQVERIYFEQPTGMYFYTPDGVGCIWFESKTQAQEQTGLFGKTIITIHQNLED